MGSDRARATFDEGRQYRRVVHQQGRVSLEADLNEAHEISVEAARSQAIDVIGPTGAPAGNDGYAIAISRHHRSSEKSAEGRDLTIAQGTFYLGGFRIVQPVAGLKYSTQKDGDWADGPAAREDCEHELVYLRLREQEISAVEDTQLLDPALGGPDTTQRVQLIRRVERHPLSRGSEDPKNAFRVLAAEWHKRGITVDWRELRLCRSSRLAVSFEISGFLGPDNQMIRVQVARPPAGDHSRQILWAYDDASALYRVDLEAASTNLTNGTLKLTPPPVDAIHQPKVGQVVEILLPAASLGDEDYVAQPAGVVATVSSAYDPSAGTIVVDPDALPSDPSAIFVRVWENVHDFVPGSPVPLVDSSGSDTGLSVTISAATPGDGDTGTQAAVGDFGASETKTEVHAIAGDYWSFAVRPAAPQVVYPLRYQRPQPPEGPREWACPLAVVDWKGSRHLDCRPRFGSLVTTSNDPCCRTLGPEDLHTKTLQDYLDETARAAPGGTIRLRAGRYHLRRPLQIRKEHLGTTIEACGAGVVEMCATDRDEAAFAGSGLIEVHNTARIRMRGLRLVMPEMSFSYEASRHLSGLRARDGDPRRALFALLQSMRPSVGVSLMATEDIRIENCSFVFSHRTGRSAFGGGIVAAGDVRKLEVHGNEFRAEGAQKDGQLHLLFGYVHVPPARQIDVVLAGAAAERFAEIFVHPARDGFSSRLLDASFGQNTFVSLTAATLVLSEVGRLRLQENEVRHSYGGFWTFAQNGGALELETLEEHEDVLKKVLHDPMVHWSVALARCLEFSSQPPSREPSSSPTPDLFIESNTAHVKGAALVGWCSGKGESASAIVKANHLRNSDHDIPTGCLAKVHTSTWTANVVVNQSHSAEQHAPALVVSHGQAPCTTALSGNVHVGDVHLPRQGFLQEITHLFRNDNR